MKGKSMKKGGKRIGAGRKPSGVTKEAVTIYTDVSKFGGREGARMAIYQFLDGRIWDTGQKAFIPLDLKDFPISDEMRKQKIPKETKRAPVTDLKPQERPKIKIQPLIHPEAPMVTKGAPKTLDDLKALCPFPEKTLERSDWIRTERQKYGI